MTLLLYLIYFQFDKNIHDSCSVMLCVCLSVFSLDGNKREVRELSDIQVGMAVMMKDKAPALQGIVQFVGQTSFASGIWVGIKLEVPLGKNNGIVQGVKYFLCLPLHGLFVRPQQLMIIVPPIVEPVKAVEMLSAPPTIKTNDSPISRRPLNNKLSGERDKNCILHKLQSVCPRFHF
jgi:hypothetical protein